MKIRRALLAGYLLLLLASQIVRWVAPAPSSGPGAARLAVATAEGLGSDTVHVVYRDLRPPGLPEAPTLVFLHGSPGGQHDLDSFIPRLRDRFRILTVDLPGFGASGRDVPDYSVRAHARYVLQLMDRQGIDRAHLVAYSMGGGVGLNLYDIAPERVASLTMLASIGVQELELFGDYRLNHFVHGAQLGALWLLREAVPHFGALDRTVLGVEYARNFYDTDQRPLRDILDRFDPPMLILHGSRDFLVLPEVAEEHHRLVPQSRLVMLDRSHFMVFNGGDYLAPPLAGFVDEVEAGRGVRRAAAAADRIAASRLPYDPAVAPRFTATALLIVLFLISVATLVSEDLTCIATGLLVAQGRLGFLPGVIACCVGIFVGDVMLYLAGRWLGRPAVERRPLRWLIRADQLESSAAWFEQRGPVVIFLSRFVPGLRLPTYFAAGVLRTGFWRFAFFFLLAVAVWTPILVGSSTLLGESAFEYFEIFRRNALPALLLLALWILVLVKLVVPGLSHRGRRRLVGAWKRWTRWEFWPPWLFYPPVVVWVVWLGLRHRGVWTFTAANPAIEAGGFIAESKWQILQGLAASPELVARTALLPQIDGLERRVDAVHAFRGDGEKSWPVVLKPDAGQRGSGVAVIRDEEQLRSYLETAHYDTLVQEYIPGRELGVFYYRYPHEQRGHILSITDKRMPTVTGDGRRSLERLILDDPRAVAMADAYLGSQRRNLDSVPAYGEEIELVELGTHCRGAIFLDGADLGGEELTAAIDRVSRGFEGFFFGRYDIRVPELDAFRRGGGFTIIELNGVTSEATHIYDPRYRVWDAWRTLFRQWTIAFEIGAANRALGAAPVSWREVAALVGRYRRGARHHA